MRQAQIEAMERRRRNWRVGLITIIVITIPFYCVGIFLWGTAPQSVQRTPVPTSPPEVITATFPGLPTDTPPGFFPSVTPLPITLQPTQIVPPTPFPTAIVPTRFLSPTPTFLPPTPFPTVAPPTIEAPTWTPLPFDN